jgi:uncharacterized protein YqgQ
MGKKSVFDALELRVPCRWEHLTIREYFHRLLKTLWEEQDGFSGKRPFGDSAWSYDLYQVLIREGFISGVLDEDGDVEDMNTEMAEVYVAKLIDAAFFGEVKDE